MVEHDFRYTLFNPQHTLIECRALVPGRYQVTGNGGSMQKGDSLLVTLKGSKDLSMRLTVESVRHLINPRGQWVAVASGPVFNELEIHQWQVKCDRCETVLDFEFAAEAKLGKTVDGIAVLVQAGSQADRIGKLQPHHLDRQRGRTLAQ